MDVSIGESRVQQPSGKVDAFASLGAMLMGVIVTGIFVVATIIVGA